MISDHHRFIFIHTPKCAGGSIRHILHQQCNGEFRNGQGHFTIQQQLDYLTSEGKDHSEYFKFSVVRNPYARLVSAFTYSAKNIANPDDYHWKSYPDSYLLLQKYTSGIDGPIANFKRFVSSEDFSRIFDANFPVHFLPQHPFITIDGRIEVDYLGDWENFNDAVESICERLKIDVARVPHQNRSNSTPYQAFYDEATRQIVYEKYKRDFEVLGYHSSLEHQSRETPMASWMQEQLART